jgi:hypothetical protein
MEVRQLKLLLFSKDESDIKCFNLNLRKLISIFVLFSVGVLGTIAFCTYLSVRYHQNHKLNQLRRQNVVLVSQLTAMEEKIDALTTRLLELDEFDDDLRMVADLPELDEDVWGVGVGGSFESYANSEISDLPAPVEKLVHSLNLDLAQLERRMDLEFGSFREIEGKLKSDKRKIRHTPTIRPVDGRLKSPFGKRKDPFLDIIDHHNGIDIAAEKGTTVSSPADGVVKVVSQERRLGHYVKIDHGDGIETLFGHLSDVKVKRHQKVKRWDAIGEVGRTGRATGYHLHYTIKVNGKAVNPTLFIYN